MANQVFRCMVETGVDHCCPSEDKVIIIRSYTTFELQKIFTSPGFWSMKLPILFCCCWAFGPKGMFGVSDGNCILLSFDCCWLFGCWCGGNCDRSLPIIELDRCRLFWGLGPDEFIRFLSPMKQNWKFKFQLFRKILWMLTYWWSTRCMRTWRNWEVVHVRVGWRSRCLLTR